MSIEIIPKIRIKIDLSNPKPPETIRVINMRNYNAVKFCFEFYQKGELILIDNNYQAYACVTIDNVLINDHIPGTIDASNGNQIIFCLDRKNVDLRPGIMAIQISIKKTTDASSVFTPPFPTRIRITADISETATADSNSIGGIADVALRVTSVETSIQEINEQLENLGETIESAIDDYYDEYIDPTLNTHNSSLNNHGSRLNTIESELPNFEATANKVGENNVHNPAMRTDNKYTSHAGTMKLYDELADKASGRAEKSIFPAAFDSEGNLVAIYEYTPTLFHGNLVSLVLSTDNFDVPDSATRLYIPNTVTRIPDGGFASCTNLTKIDIDNTAERIIIGENAFPANAQICYLETDQTEAGYLSLLTKSVSNLSSRLIAPRTWAEIKQAVKLGLAPGLFPVGYEFEVERSDGDPLIFRVVDYDNIQAADPGLQHTMALELKYIYGQGNAAYTPIQFDAPEALFYAETALEPGTYHFNLNGLTAAGVNLSDGDYQFTLAQTLPQGGQITLDATAGTINTYAEIGGTTAIESNILLSQGTGGTDLGTTGNGNFNNVNRAVTGSNNYAQSAMRQFLNSNTASGSVWTPQTKFDRLPSWANTVDGFMKNLPSDFLAAVEPATILCRTNTKYESQSLDGTQFSTSSSYKAYDKFFLISRAEWDKSSNVDGTLLDYYSGLSATERIPYDKDGVARTCFTRTGEGSNAYQVNGLRAQGILSVTNASGNTCIRPICIIA